MQVWVHQSTPGFTIETDGAWSLLELADLWPVQPGSIQVYFFFLFCLAEASLATVVRRARSHESSRPVEIPRETDSRHARLFLTGEDVRLLEVSPPPEKLASLE